MARIFCPKCSSKLSPSDSKCPKCGSQDRFIDDTPLLAIDKLTFRVSEKISAEKKKTLYETTIKPDFDRDTQQDTIAIRHFDKRKEYIELDGSYIEEIRARDGQIIKKNVGKLSEHKGHGSDRKTKREKDSVGGGDFNG